MLKVNEEEIHLFSKYIKDLTGIVLDESKAYLIESRLWPLSQELNCASYSELYYKSINDKKKLIQNKIIDAISTHETFFFRDDFIFELLKNKILPEYISRKSNKISGALKRNLRIWSAGCSTGQEAYSIAIALKETLVDLSEWSINIFGTDISESSITQAKNGSFNESEVKRGINESRLANYFSKKGDLWYINEDIKSLVRFELEDINNPVNNLGTFDIIFCRNVSIYFSPEIKKKLFDRIADLLKIDGFLIIGSTESLLGINDILFQKRVKHGVYYQLK